MNREVMLGQICDHIAGKYLDKSEYESDGQYVIYGSNSVMGRHKAASHKGPLTVLARIGSNAGAVRYSKDDCWVNNNASAMVAKSGVDARWLHALLQLTNMEHHRAGSGQPFIRIDSLLSSTVSVPPLAEQRRIAGVLGALDELIEVNRRLVRDLDALFHAEWARRFASVAAVPSVQLSDLCSTQYGFTDAATTEPSGPKFLRVADINKRNWVEWDTVPHCSAEAREGDKYRLRKGDLVVARMADPGKCARVESDVDAVFASYLVKVTPSDPSLGLFLFGYLKSALYADYSQSAMTGSVQKNMNAKVIAGSWLTVPGSEETAAFNAFGEPIRDAITSLVTEIAELTSTRDELIPLLMSGRIRVADGVAALA